MFGLSFWEIAIIMAVALIVFGPSKLPELAKSLGKGLREFRKATEDFKSTIDSETHRADTPPPKQVQGEQKAALPADGSGVDATEAELVESARPEGAAVAEEAADKAAGAAAAAAAVTEQTGSAPATEASNEPAEEAIAPEGTIARGADPDASEKKAES
jgi:TatA/E family protein of Tat protein translocase